MLSLSDLWLLDETLVKHPNQWQWSAERAVLGLFAYVRGIQLQIKTPNINILSSITVAGGLGPDSVHTPKYLMLFQAQ